MVLGNVNLSHTFQKLQNLKKYIKSNYTQIRSFPSYPQNHTHITIDCGFILLNSHVRTKSIQRLGQSLTK